jgi:D-alanyl-lipoteichoic acid acyltransferase DltB (MBOAT superfamily)
MVFNSIIYLIFLFITLVIYYLIPLKWRWGCLLLASVVYYLSFIPLFIGVIAVLIIINFSLSGQLAKAHSEKRRHYLIATICINILILAFFKYFNVIISDFKLDLYQVDFFYRVGTVDRPILPLGLSYIVFTILSYQIELYRESISPEPHLGYFSLYTLFFPKIGQGPIERPQKLLPQFREDHRFRPEFITQGAQMILLGYFKKLVVADRLAIYVNAVFDNSQHHNGITLLLATLFFAFQIYADFSGYTDIALGSAKLFGYDLTNNFRRPYLATSVKDFWDRWHITFSTWLRDYIFLPLAYFFAHKFEGRSILRLDPGKVSYTVSIMITFIVCGIWHGVGWTYLVWGALFGFLLSFSNLTKDFQKTMRKKLGINKSSPGYRFYSIGLTFVLVLIAWIFFRANTLTEAGQIIGRIITFSGKIFYKPSELGFAILAIGSIMVMDLKLEFFPGRLPVLSNRNFVIRLAGIAILIMMIILLGALDGGQFIYFQY